MEETSLVQVCQIGVMTDFDIVTLSQDGDFDFKTITIFLFSKFNQELVFFSLLKSNDFSALLLVKRHKFAQRNTILQS